MSTRSLDAANKLFQNYRHISQGETNHCLDELINAGIWYDEPRGRWLVSRYEHVRAVLNHPDLLNNLQLARPSTKSWALAQRLGNSRSVPLLFVDPPTHSAARAAFLPLFSRAQIRQLAPWIAEEASRSVASLRRFPEFDLATELAQPFAVSLILRAFGISSMTNDIISQLVNDSFALNRLFDLTCSPGEIEAGQAASLQLYTFIENKLLMESGMEQFIRQFHVPRDLALASIEFSLRAGIVTTSCLLVHILVHLFSESSQLKSNSSVEKDIAEFTPTLEAGRVSASTVDIGEFTIPARETVICVLPAANRDLILSGKSIRSHLTFGAGRHRCIGEHLVREAAQSIVTAMKREGCGIRLLGGDEYHYTPSFRGLRRVRVQWTTFGER